MLQQQHMVQALPLASCRTCSDPTGSSSQMPPCTTPWRMQVFMPLQQMRKAWKGPFSTQRSAQTERREAQAYGCLDDGAQAEAAGQNLPEG